jgi:maltooligosyltrehalose trehalohydrolase
MKNFSVWAPEKERMMLHVVAPFDREYEMIKNEAGYFTVDVDVNDDVRYYYKPDGEKDVPDPVSAFQPDGVHGPSQTVDHSLFDWQDESWKGLALNETILYELHVGTFTPEGTFDAIIPRLQSLKEIGINAIELMPVSQFPGTRNWGYDGAYPYAVQHSYGGPDGLKRLVNACHREGIAVYLDVVYNHLGPEGNYLPLFGPYFTQKYSTPWGAAINFDSDWSDGVRDFFSNNIIYWFKYYHIDGLRCDAIHVMFDSGAVHFWELVNEKKIVLEKGAGRKFVLIAESDLNSPKVVKKISEGGFGFDAQWLDDFHHALYKMINTNDPQRYYDFGSIEQLAKAYTDGFVHSGEWVKFRKRKHGASSAGVSGDKFVVFNLNHDQAGNRAGGERLCMLVDFERVKLAAAALLLSPYVPMLFMGEEYGDDSPFYYFVSHSDEELIKAVREGRKAEFAEFGFDDQVPDPQDEETFRKSVIQWHKRERGHYQKLLQWHKQLIAIRKTYSAFKTFDKQNTSVNVIESAALALVRSAADNQQQIFCLFNFSDKPVEWKFPGKGKANKILDSHDAQWSVDNEVVLAADHLQPQQSITISPVSSVVYDVTQSPA